MSTTCRLNIVSTIKSRLDTVCPACCATIRGSKLTSSQKQRRALSVYGNIFARDTVWEASFAIVPELPEQFMSHGSHGPKASADRTRDLLRGDVISECGHQAQMCRWPILAHYSVELDLSRRNKITGPNYRLREIIHMDSTCVAATLSISCFTCIDSNVTVTTAHPINICALFRMRALKQDRSLLHNDGPDLHRISICRLPN